MAEDCGLLLYSWWRSTHYRLYTNVSYNLNCHCCILITILNYIRVRSRWLCLRLSRLGQSHKCVGSRCSKRSVEYELARLYNKGKNMLCHVPNLSLYFFAYEVSTSISSSFLSSTFRYGVAIHCYSIIHRYYSRLFFLDDHQIQWTFQQTVLVC